MKYGGVANICCGDGDGDGTGTGTGTGTAADYFISKQMKSRSVV